MERIRHYTLKELEKEHEGILIQTQEGTDVMIRLRHGKTLITLPFGNDFEEPETAGVLSKGMLVTPRPPLEEEVREALRDELITGE